MQVTQMQDGREMVSYEVGDRMFCLLCGAFAIVPLTPSQIAKQPDDTTHVCHPAFGGCNHGFAKE